MHRHFESRVFSLVLVYTAWAPVAFVTDFNLARQDRGRRQMRSFDTNRCRQQRGEIEFVQASRPPISLPAAYFLSLNRFNPAVASRLRG